MSNDEIFVDTPDAPDAGMQAVGAAVPTGPLNAPSDEVSPDSPDSPDTGTQMAPGGALSQALHPRHSVVWDGDTVFVRGASGPLRFIFARMDGQSLSLPASAAVTITPPDNSTPPPITPDVEASTPQAQQVLACDYVLTQRGLYTIKILAAFDSGIAGASIAIICDD